MVAYVLAAEATGVNTTVLNGALMLALPVSLLAGLVSFFSPCVLPLVPGYLSYVTSVSGADLAEARRGRMLAGALLFIAGFTAVTTLSLDQASAGRGALLTVAYCLGLGLPFILTAIAFRKALGAFGWVKKHYAWVMRIGGGMLILTGLLLVTGMWASIVSDMQSWTQSFTVGI